MEEQWRFYGFCDSFEQARYIAMQGLSAGLGAPSQAAKPPACVMSTPALH